MMSTARILEALAQSQLLEPDQKSEVIRKLGRFADGHALAQDLVRRDWLTPYQANQLLQGKVADLMVGQYILLERLGEGGMGQVFKARHRNLQRIVALKLIRREFLNNQKAQLRFQREMRAAGQLSHPNIVRAFDADQVDGCFYMALEFIDGVDLDRLVKQQGPLMVPQACDYIRQAAQGLQHAYEQGLIHRDIKPANLLMTRQPDKNGTSGLIARPADLLQRPTMPGSGLLSRPPGNGGPWGLVKLLDLGLARWIEPTSDSSLGNLTQLGTLMGTPDFIAPEQARNSHASDIRADLYSLGCTMYFLIAGRVPYPTGTLTEKLLQHQFDDPAPLEQARRNRLLAGPGVKGQQATGPELLEVDPAVQEMVRKLMAKRPEDRFQTPGELVVALESWLTHPTIRRPTAPPNQGPTLLDIAAPAEPLVEELAKTVLVTTDVLRAKGSGAETILGKRKNGFFAKPARRWICAAALGGALLIGAAAAAFSGRAGQPQTAKAPVPDKHTPPTEKKAPLSEDEFLWQSLVQEFEARKGDPTELRQKLLRFRQDHCASQRVPQATALLSQMPSPFDTLDRAKLDKRFTYAWHPEAVVGILGIPRGLTDHRAIASVAIGPDGALLALGQEESMLRTVVVTAPANFQRVFSHKGAVNALAFSPDGRTLASAGADGALKCWDAKTLRFSWAAERQNQPVTGLAFHPGGAILAASCQDGKVRLYDPTSGTLKKTYSPTDGPATSVVFTPDGKFLFWSSASGLVRWVPTDGALDRDQVLNGFQGAIHALSFSPDSKTLVAAGEGGVVRICSWNGATLLERTWRREHKATVHGAAVSPNGQELVTVGADGVVRLWNLQTGKPEKSWEMRWPIHGVAFAPDGRHFATANGNHTVFIFRIDAPPAGVLAWR